MCDQTELSYGDGDVVWVKIGPIWWPGVVRDVEKEGKGKEVFGGLRTKPIAAVQFFDEDKYEFVKSLENIYHYNCRRKDEFIKKGLDKHRTGAKHMAKFPEDVGKAEALVGGDENIVNDPKFAPQEKAKYSDIFGSAKKKEKKKSEDMPLKTKFLPLKKRMSAPVQSRQAPRTYDPSTPRRPLVEEGAEYTCPFCSFTARFIASISSHVTMAHSARRVDYAPAGYSPSPSTVIRTYTEPKRSRPTVTSGKKRGRPAKPKEGTPKVPTEEPTPDKTPLKRPAPVASVSEKSDKKKRFTDALLADWSEDDDDVKDAESVLTDLNENVSGECVSNHEKSAEVSALPEKAEMEEDSGKVDTSGSADAIGEGDKKEIVSCFDFDEEDDGFIGMSNANTYGRKIPRVIPVKDKTDLGMDLEIEELFKRKPDSEQDEIEETEKKNTEDEAEPEKKRRGRRPKVDKKEVVKALKPIAKVSGPPEPASLPKETLASTRERRPGARKSYLNEVIEKLDETVETVRHQESSEEGASKPSRRKQDLKRQSLKELDDIESLALAKKRKEEEEERLAAEEMEAPERPVVSKKKKKVSLSIDDSDDLNKQVESLLAETEPLVSTAFPATTSPAPHQSLDDELLEGTVEYLEDEPEAVLPTPVKPLAPVSPIKKWKEDIRLALEGEPTVKKSVIPQWKQGIQEAIKANIEPQPPKDIIVEGKRPITEPVTSNVVKLSKLTGQTIVQQKGNTYYIVKQQNRPKILGKPQPQQVMLVTNPRNAQQRVKVVASTKPSTVTVPTSSQSVVQFIHDGKGGMKKVAMPKQVIQIGAKNSPQKYVISGKGKDGLHVIENYNGTGKTVIVKEVGAISGASSGVLSLRKKLQTLRSGLDSAENQHQQTAQCVIKRVKGPDGKYTIQKIVKGVRVVNSDKGYSVAQQRPHTTVLFKNKEPVKLAVPEIEPIPEPPVIEQTTVQLTPTPQPVMGTQQVVAMPGPDGQTTYMLVTVDNAGLIQAMDSPLLTYDVQPDVTSELYGTPSDDLTPVYPSGQDILAEALANTNVLESEMPLMMPSVVQETPVPLQKPMVIAGTQETSINLQKPIMTPVEVPSSIVPDTSGLEPPPLPPTPTDEDILMEDSEGGLMIAEQPPGDQELQGEPQEELQIETEQQEPAHAEVAQTETQPVGQGDFFIDDSQEGEEVNSFQSMPLLNEESTASEEPIGNQHFEVQVSQMETSEYLPTSTNPDLEPEQSQEGVCEDVLVYAETQEEGKEEKAGDAQTSIPFISEEGFVIDGTHRSQETEVTSTTGDSKDNTV